LTGIFVKSTAVKKGENIPYSVRFDYPLPEKNETFVGTVS
jgi:hypothetical protein